MSSISRDEVKKEVLLAFCVISPELKKIDESYSIFMDIGFDSLDFAEVLMEIEEKFNINIEAEDVMDCKTVRDLIERVCEILP